VFPDDSGNLIRCDCGHAVAQHSTAGCGSGECSCVKTPAGVIVDEIAALRPEWDAGQGK
jgi:hypothetical protein